MNKWRNSSFLLAFLLSGTMALAHFQLIVISKANFSISERGKQLISLIFTHPFEANAIMDMGKDIKNKLSRPVAFGVMTAKPESKPTQTDLLPALKEKKFSGKLGYQLDYQMKGIGDFVFYLDPAPYWEPAEDCYIKQITKVVVNKGSVATCWDTPVGLAAEIIPLDMPYALWTGNVFRGIVTRNGKPVANAEIEVEYLNHNFDGEKFTKEGRVKAPADCYVTQTIKSNDRGEFSYGIPKAGWWGFAAINLAPEMKKDGKQVELGAVLWVHAEDMK
jgi:cobalt/nickel transport protein